MSDSRGYDWVAAALAIASTESNSLAELAEAASLNPLTGDFSDIDLEGLDLRNQNFEDWDLRNANFNKAKIAGVNLRGALVRVDHLLQAQDWQKAYLSDDLRLAATNYHILTKNLRDTKLTLRTVHALSFSGIRDIGNLVVRSEAEIIRLPNMGRISLQEVRSLLTSLGLRFSMNVLFESLVDKEPVILPQTIEYRTWNSELSRSSQTKVIDAALAKLSKQESLKLIRVHSCRVAFGSFIQFDAVEVRESGAVLVSVKALGALGSASGALRTAVIRKATPVIEDARRADINVEVIFVILKYFKEEFQIPLDLKQDRIRFLVYDP